MKNGVEWAERVMDDKTQTPHHDTERMFNMGLAGKADVSDYIPTPRQLAALDAVNSIAMRKLWIGGSAGVSPRSPADAYIVPTVPKPSRKISNNSRLPGRSGRSGRFHASLFWWHS